MKKRMGQIEEFMQNPLPIQEQTFSDLISRAKNTEIGKKYGFAKIKNPDAFQKRVPIHTYEDLFPYIDRLMKGEQNLLWDTEIKWFSKSSGTTSSRSKFIPVSNEAMEDSHFRGGKDVFVFRLLNKPDTRFYAGKGLSIGGSLAPSEQKPKSYIGDVSAVIMKNLPLWAQFMRTPSLDVALMDNWEEKIEKMANDTIDEDVRVIMGVPTWALVVLNRILEKTGKKDIREVWPEVELFVHGAVSFDPYRELFKSLISGPMDYMDTYNASEGFFGIQDQMHSTDFLLMPDYGIYYEFIPMENYHDENPKTVRLDEVEIGKNYAMIISTNAGLWRYKIGDTIKFTSKSPYRFRITGRTKHFINAFGEEVIIENAQKALIKACEITGAKISDYTAGPRYLQKNEKGGHEWIIEFDSEPDDLEKFIQGLDEALRDVNSDYDAKRSSDLALVAPVVHKAPKGTFYNWLKSKGKLGGQNKVPRLSNDREYLDEILKLL